MKAHSNSAPGALPVTLHPEQRLRLGQVQILIGYGSSWIHREIKAGRFPEPEKDGPRWARWRAGEVLDWQRNRKLDAESAPRVVAARREEAAARQVAKEQREQAEAA